MGLLNKEEISSIALKCGYSTVHDYILKEFDEKMNGFLGEHLQLIIEVEKDGLKEKLDLFVKCLPRYDAKKAEYLEELSFFKKEYVMLSSLFKDFQNEGPKKWRPDLLFIKENVFVFENVTHLGYKMPHHQGTMTLEEIKAVVRTLAKFHAQSFIYEDKKSKELGRQYKISEDYFDYLQEPQQTMAWRDTGMNAAIGLLTSFSKYKSKPNFAKLLNNTIPLLFNAAVDVMRPSAIYPNVVVHRDLWTNNIFLKKEKESYHALFIDFQTVLYCSPLLDLSSFIYFNTSKEFRDAFTTELIEYYYSSLAVELNEAGINVDNVFEKSNLLKAYNDSIVFGMTQAALIVPIIAMSKEKREEIFCDPQKAARVNEETRSKEFIDIAIEDEKYKVRVIDLLDEIVERFLYPDDHGYLLK